MKVGYEAQAFLSLNGGTGKGAQLRTLIGPFMDQFLGFASNEPNHSGLPLIQEGASGHTLWQQLSLPFSLRRHAINIFLAPANVAPFYIPRSVDLILVLHDTILMQGFRTPGEHKKQLMDAYRRWQIGPSVRRARIVLTISEHARGEILKAFPSANVRIIPCTVPERWFTPRPIQSRAGYLLMTTSSAPHKNADGALKAYAHYAHKAGTDARPLRIVGMSKQAGLHKDFLEREKIADLVMFLPFLSEAELIAQYQDAGALLLPSFAEGFGIPMLEAMATGTPILAANTTSLPEVGGVAAQYFDPHNIEDMAETIYQVVSDKSLQETMAAQGLLQVQKYAPGRVRQQVVSFWKEVAGVDDIQERE